MGTYKNRTTKYLCHSRPSRVERGKLCRRQLFLLCRGSRVFVADGGFEDRAGAKHWALTGWNRDLLLGADVTARTSRTMTHLEGPEPGQRDLFAGFQSSGDGVEDGIYRLVSFRLRHPRLLGNLSYEITFLHGKSP